MAELVTNEFFEQGDMERRNFNITPIVIKKNICTKDYTVVIYLIFKFYFTFLGYNESRKRRPVANDASWIH